MVLGVDGCRGGWVVADDAGGVTVVPRFDLVIALDGGVIAVDMPIGLPERGSRACDVEARRRLGPRRRSVFPAPVRSTLASATYCEAVARHRAADGRALSRQSFHLLRKIAEVDEHWDQRVHEAHPELAFAHLLGHPAEHPKRTGPGRAERLHALGLAAPPRASGAAADDVLDALALVHLARRVSEGAATPLGDGSVDTRGRPMVIWA